MKQMTVCLEVYLISHQLLFFTTRRRYEETMLFSLVHKTRIYSITFVRRVIVLISLPEMVFAYFLTPR